MLRRKKQKEMVSPPDRETYRDFTDALDAAVLIITAEHEIRYMSEAAERAWGSKEGKKCHLVLRNSRTACSECPLEDVVVSSGAEKCEMRMCSLDGWHDYENLYVHVGDPSYPVQYVALLSTNIDERKSLEREAMESERRFRDLFDSSIDGIIYTDMEGRILNANNSYLDMLGYSLSEIRSLTNQQLTPAMWHEMEAEITRSQVAVRGYSDEYEKENIRKDGSMFPVSVRVWLTEGEDEEPVGMWGIVRDITERKAAEEALGESEEKYRLIADSSYTGIFLHDGTELMYMNDRASEISGYPREHFKSMEDVISLLSPGERERIVGNMKRRIAGEDIAQVYDTTIIRADGETANVQLMSNSMTIGGKLAILVVVNDMTERVEAEEALMASEEKYRTLVESSRDAILIADADGVVLFANTAAAQLSGIEPDKLVGQSLFNFTHPDVRKETIKFVYGEWAAGRDVTGLHIRVMVNGKEGYFEATVAVLGEPGPEARAMVLVRDVTEQEENQRRLKESEERYRTIVENSNDPILVINRSGELLYANEATERVFGFSSDDIMGANMFQFVHPDDRENTALAFMQDWKTGQTIPNYPVKLVKADGSTVYTEMMSGIIGWPEEDAKQIFVVRDVTERHHREAERALKLKIEEGLAAITSRFIDPVDVNVAIEETLEVAGELLGADRACYFETSKDRQTVSGVMEWTSEGVEPLGEEIRELVARRGQEWMEMFGGEEVIVFDDARQVSRKADRDIVEEKGFTSVAAAQVFIAGDLVGFIGISDDKRERQWSEHEIGLVRGMAETVSRALERRDWVEELERSERFRTRITENIDEGLVVLRNGIVTWVNRRLCEIHGYEPEELIGRTTEFLVPGGEYIREYVSRMLTSLKETGRYVSEEKAVRKDGTVIDVLLAVTPLVGTEEEGTFELLAAVRDITEARRMQAEVKAAADAYSTLFSTAGDGLVVHSMEGKIMDANERASIYTGYEKEELLGMNVASLAQEEDRLLFMGRRDELGEKRSTVFEVGLKRKEGGTTPVEITARLTRIWGESVVLSSLRDITERKKAEEALKESEGRLRMAGKAAYDLIYEWDVETGGRKWFGDIDGILGYKQGEISQSIEAWLNLIHPEDTERLANAVEFHTTSSEPIQYEYRVKHMDGSWRHWNDHGLPLLDSNGRPYTWIGVCTDITARKRAEEETRRRAAQLSSLNEISKAATSSLNLDIVLEEILDVALDVSGVGSGVITVQAPSRGERTAVVAGRGLSFGYIKRVNDEGVRRKGIEYATSGGSDIMSPDRDCSPEVNPWVCEDLLTEGMAQAVFIPLLSGEKIMGGMVLASESPGRFEERDIGFYNAVGAEIGVSVENALVYRELAAEHERLSLLYRIAQSISGELELEALLETTVEEAARVVGADNALIAQVEPGSREYKWSASYNVDIKKMDGVLIPIGSGMWGMAVESKRAVRFPLEAVTEEDLKNDKVAGRLGIRSGIVVPLISGDRVMGVMGIHFTSGENPLSDEDTLLLEAIGRQAGVVIDKAQLFEETKRHLDALEKAHRELMVLDRMKSDFVSTVSHELRSPLAVIEGFAKTLVEHFDRIDRETERESIEIILKKAIALEGLIENILDMSRIEEGRLDVSLEPLDVVELCEFVREDQERVAELHEVTLEAPTGEITVVADREKVEVALGNLVRNAVKFSPDGGKVTISVREAGGMVEIEVTDQGIGIPVEEHERVFDRFYQVDSGETRTFQGSGLGLYITWELVEAMGGTVTMESEPGLGSTFRFTLPLAR